jgi:transposase, IS30 family
MSHLSYEQRYTIEVLLCEGKSQIEIAQRLSRSKSVISREIKRNCDQRSGLYKSKLAQSKYDTRLSTKPKKVKFCSAIEHQIITLLSQEYSPEQITGFLRKEGFDTMSHEWIYQFIWEDKKQGGQLHKHLRRKGRRYRKRGFSKDSRGKIVGRVGIEKRPKEAEQRTIFGHLEVDTIIGKNHIGAIITLNERASGMVWMRKVESKDATQVRIALSEMLEEIRPYIRSITGDNGKEFAEHQHITDQYCDFYFANPYSPWERGSNENLNGLIRQYIPKSSCFSQITNDQILEIQHKLNNRPRKRFGYQNPIFVMEKLLFNPEVAFVT